MSFPSGRIAGYKSLKEHMRDVGCCDEAILALESASSEYWQLKTQSKQSILEP
jgi:hypothetical protein